MTDKSQRPEIEETKAKKAKKDGKAVKPPISKAIKEITQSDHTSGAANRAKMKSNAKTKPKTGSKTETNGRSNGRSAAEAASLDREALLEVDSYDEAEALLTERPDLIEPARVIFGSVVPTSGQNSFVDLAIRAAADDDALTLANALKAKRRDHLNLTAPEADQLLEFGGDNAGKFPRLALYIALLLTDDLTHLEDAALWQKQKEIVLTTEKVIEVDATALWEKINGPDPKPAKKEPKPEPVKAKVVAPKKKKQRPAPPPLPLRVKKKRYVKKGSGEMGDPPRWVVAAGFIFLLSMMSCGVCALGWF